MGLNFYLSLNLCHTLPKFYFFSVFFIANIAKGKAARQSSTSDNGDPNRAVDGNKDPRYAANSCSHTGNDHQAWWRVDLGNEEEVLVVKITNRQEASSRLRRIRIFVGNVDGKPSDNPE